MIPARGFIALISVIIICSVLLALATGASLSGFYAREDSERAIEHERAYDAARACITETMLALMNDPVYAGDATSTLDTSTSCYTSAITLSGMGYSALYTFETTAHVGDAQEVLRASVRATDDSLVSETEVP